MLCNGVFFELEKNGNTFFVLRTPFSGFCQKLLIIKILYNILGKINYISICILMYILTGIFIYLLYLFIRCNYFLFGSIFIKKNNQTSFIYKIN